MSGGKRPKLRVRKTRPIGEAGDSPPTKNHPEPELIDGSWFLPEPISNRLHQKSALGKPVPGGIILSDEEVMFCHWNRHVPLPTGWVEERMSQDPNFAYKSVVFDVVREGGDKVVPVDGKWLRWPRESHPSRGEAEAVVRWARTGDDLDMGELLSWAHEISRDGLLAELALIDDEMDVTMYRLSLIDPSGTIQPASRDEYPLLGVEHLSSRFLRNDELDWINGVENEVTNLFGELNSRGLLMRPGFKYGCRWRVYSTPVDEDHAPWLLQMEQDSPKNWEGVSLSVRLAEGVHKGWVVALKRDDWNFLLIRRHLPGR
jgi:hypothetical protein